ncbi:ketoacyl-synt-domain-containing protein [Westerdykella ornata]|uniref:Ketoacyl-synt-domain-containing protein n=1 Tax=Westerdykella ornata TaxID=318751 RepID=A0A6A6JCM6_WESOR|nr:ketoacyl-synt-domain-containing protein [Westerdykella ornata]KAF2274182.1 ketoacyl-synt-domain-containing protein [Westerdykella ornata]
MSEPIAIIGTGCRFPGGADTPSKLWSVIRDPKDLSRKPPDSRFNIDAFYHPVGTHHGTTNALQSYCLEDEGRSNVTEFDAGFFNVQAAEADAMDPQQRLLMGVVYDSLCAAGQSMEKLRGSDTAVYVGCMCDDYNTMLTRDWETLPRYTATGLERGILANRISYFFDWHGPSLSIDTACSSSLVALDHAVQAIRSGRSKIAVAAGTSLILSPAMYISESKLGMLSATGRCAMWDVAADGYTRGEGVAPVVLKTLSQALADNDPIDCIIRETGVNQDDRTPGLTMPSSLAQAALIRQCYAKAGLDPVNNPQDRPQFFQAHGTGTQAGDPQEAEAIANALFPGGSRAASTSEKLLVGSVKTVIGHTEDTAGLASEITTSLALKHGIVPPNLHFKNLNPKVAPFYDHLEIPTAPTPWPSTNGSDVRRASVNSFGFGGTNSHCILELPLSKPTPDSSSVALFTPLVFSAASATLLRTMLSWHLDYLKTNPDVKLTDLAYTLQHRRSTLPYRTSIVARDVPAAIESLEGIVSPAPDQKAGPGLDTRFATLPRAAKVIGIFTGQGAQWARMGAELIEISPFASSRMEQLDEALQSLPNAEDRPVHALAQAALSQPLCTAVQILLVDILREAGVHFTAVVGHSSGETGAAYAAGFLSAQDAIRVAYFRGVHAKRSASPNAHSPRGAMMAIGASAEDAAALCREARFEGRLQVAAVNSNSSVTLCGDEDAINEAEAVLKAERTFARKLKVDTANHSAHMLSCAGPYLASLSGCGIKTLRPSDDVATHWFSSVHRGMVMTPDALSNQYWVDNMCNTVEFAGALNAAILHNGAFDVAIEVGPHAALQGPALATLDALRAESSTPYTSSALGYIWAQLGSESIRFFAVQALLSGEGNPSVLQDLPPYPRIPNHYKHRDPRHVTNAFQWRKMLQPSKLHWLKGHMLQGQTVFPATGYSCPDTPVSLIRLQDIDIPRAIAFNDDSSTVEAIFSVTAEWACYSVPEGAAASVLNAKGRVWCRLAPAEPDILPVVKADAYNLVDVDEERFYANLSGIGYDYAPPFRGLSNIRRKLDYSTGDLQDQSGTGWDDNLALHPGMLDSALQTVFAAWSYPGDTSIWSLHVPVSISSVTINPYFTSLSEGGKQATLRYESHIRSRKPSTVGEHAFVQFEGATLVPFSRATSKNDLPIFSKFEYGVAFPDGQVAANGETMSEFENAICSGPTGRWLARILSQIAHRHPSLDIFEVGAGTGATTSAVLKEMGDTYSSYTFTDISSGFFIDTEERFAKEAGRIVFKTFNMEKASSGQGFVEGVYDVVVAVNLSNVWRLLKPGGFLVVAELTSTELLFSGMTVGTLPGWWIGAETGRPWGPLLTLRQWDSTLRKVGFSGIDTVSPDISASLPMSVFVAQAVDDQITLLRNSPTARERPANVRNDDLAIDVAHVLSHRFQNKQHFDTMEGFAASDLAASKTSITVLSLVDLDRPYLEELTPAKFDPLKTLWAVGGTVVWVNCGAKAVRPYSHMMKGIIRTVQTEYPNLSVQMYDLDPKVNGGTGIEQRTATDLALNLLREHILHEWGTNSGLLWTPEPGITVSEGKELFTRLVPDVEKNQRYNARRRDVITTADAAHETLQLVAVEQSEKEWSLELQKTSPLRLSRRLAAGQRNVRVKYSLLQSLAVGVGGYSGLCLGTDEDTGETIIALTESSASLVRVPDHCCVSIGNTSSPSLLASVANNLIAQRILSLVPKGTTLLVNEAGVELQAAVTRIANATGVHAVFTRAGARQQGAGHSIFLHPNLHQRAILEAIPNSVAVFVHFSRGAASDALRKSIVKCVPPACLKIVEGELMSYELNPPPTPEAEATIVLMLKAAVNDTLEVDDFKSDVETLTLEDITQQTKSGASLRVLDWTTSTSVPVKVEPIDNGIVFRADRTYLFVGMAGELGQSLAEWMIKHGARTVVLTSRNPKVNLKFIEDMRKRYGALVRAQSLDINPRQFLDRALGDIKSTLHPILDELFGNMKLESFRKVTAPKVLRTQLLDQAFYNDTSLDFFILTSGIASIIGWTGQSNYSAANEWMTSLASSRRARGLAASTVNIPAVLGIGYAAHADNFDFDYFQSLGHINISEQDLHALFAEGILSGRPGQGSNQVCMGVTFIPPDFEVKASHKRDVKFSHFIQRGEKQADIQAAKTSVRVKVQLQVAQTPEESYAITRDAFWAQLRRLLRIPEEEKLDGTTGLVDRGVDSLVAVDLRAWFLKELGVDVPTLKILGGGSIADLIRTALEKMVDVAAPAITVSTAQSSGSSLAARSPSLTPAPPSSESASSVAVGLGGEL